MSVQSIYHWRSGAFEALDYCDTIHTSVVAADSWLVIDGSTLALNTHRDRFFAAIADRISHEEFANVWEAAVNLIPREGEWFPRIELNTTEGSEEAGLFLFRLRSAPERTRSVSLATWAGADPRIAPSVKGPDLHRMMLLRSDAWEQGATEAVILTPEGYVVEGSLSALLWWRGSILCGPLAEFDRVNSVTARCVLTLAQGLGIDTHEEAVTPAELDGTEVWVLSALHGPRIATAWVDGPRLAELPGRLEAWRSRMAALRRPIHA